MTTLLQGDLQHDLGILHTAVKENQGVVGVYASVVGGGTIHRGDSIRLWVDAEVTLLDSQMTL